MYKYFPCSRNSDGEPKVNPGQQYPMYNIFECNSTEIILTPKNVEGVYAHDGTKVSTYLISNQMLAGVHNANTLESKTYTIKLPTI